jgi:hypothetical protein
VTQAPTATPEEAAQAALLTIYDLPLGWRKDVDQEEDDPVFEFSPGCSVLNELEEPPGQIAYAEADDFEGPDRQVVSNDATVFTDEDAAISAIALYNDALTRCGTEFLAAIDQGVLEGWAEEGLTDARVTTYWSTPSEIDFDAESNGYRFVMEAATSGLEFAFTFDMYFVRHGRLVVSYTHMALGDVDTAELQSIGLAAAEKALSASSSLGG